MSHLRFCTFAALIAALSISISTNCLAADGDAPAATQADHSSGPFHEGNWALTLSQAGAVGDNVYPLTTTFGVGYYLSDDFAVNLEIPYYYCFEEGDDANAAGLQLLLRKHFWKHDRWTLYADVAGGMFLADRRVPTGGTDFNWTFRTGLGATYQIKDDVHVFGGIRYFHLSNGRLEGVDRNPDFNVVEGYIGLMFMLN